MFEHSVVWITGASSGIGRALAFVFADEGARVVLSARREEQLQETAEQVRARGREALVLPCDVTGEAQVERAAGRIEAHFGQLDVAVANAGFGVVGRVEELSAADWRRQLDVNVVGLAVTARHALPLLRRSNGRLALVGSAGATVPLPGMGAYSASKAAVRMIGQTLEMELHGSGVSCTTLHPGFVESNLARVDNQGHYHPGRKDPRSAELMWPTERAARVMARAIHCRQRQYVFTGHGKVLSFIARHWPGLWYRAATWGLLPTGRGAPAEAE